MADITPTLPEIGAIIRSRTEGLRAGSPTGTFTDSTTPTAAEVTILAQLAADQVADTLGNNIPDEFADRARGAATLYGGALVEGGASSPRTELIKLWTGMADARVKALAIEIEEVGAGGQEGPSDDGLMPVYSFPVDCSPRIF